MNCFCEAIPLKQQQRPDQRIGYFPDQQPVPTPAINRYQASAPAKPKINMFRLAALIVCVVVFLTCFFLLVRYAYNILISRNASARLEDAYIEAQQTNTETPAPATPTPAPTAAPTAALAAVPIAAPTQARPLTALDIWPTTYASNPTMRVSPIFYQLQAQNKDIIGWLKIEDVLEEAVLQRDNDYYLTHNVLKQKSLTGALFLDENCDLDTVPTQMLIHGHNMKEGAMFGSLKKYKVKDASFYRAHPFIDFNTIYENGRYVIFAVGEVDIRSGRPDYLPFWQNTRFSSADAFMAYVERAQLLSHYRCNVEVVPGDRLLTLSTCTGTDDNKRLIVMARKIRDGENEFELNMSILSTSDR